MFTEDSVYLGKQEKYQNFENLLIFVSPYQFCVNRFKYKQFCYQHERKKIS